MKTRLRGTSIAWRIAIIFSVASIFSVANTALAANNDAAANTASGAAFTAAQATTGGGVYASQCASCHAANLQGDIGPALEGAQFHQMAAAQQLTGTTLLAVISQAMPKNNPGSLSETDYADVTAYILKRNGYPAGATTLSASSSQLKALDLTNTPSGGH